MKLMMMSLVWSMLINNNTTRDKSYTDKSKHKLPATTTLLLHHEADDGVASLIKLTLKQYIKQIEIKVGLVKININTLQWR
jgi:hypothetical protein